MHWDYYIPADGNELAAQSELIVSGTFEKKLGQRPAHAVGMGPQGNVDVWQFRVATVYKGNPGAVVHVMRWPDEVYAEQYHVKSGEKAVLFLVGTGSGLTTVKCGDAGLLLVGSDGRTLRSPGAFVSGVGSIAEIEALA